MRQRPCYTGRCNLLTRREPQRESRGAEWTTHAETAGYTVRRAFSMTPTSIELVIGRLSQSIKQLFALAYG
jgi:hypothetical protein